MITLVIIGVIAAITVPTLITKYQKEQTVTRLKKAYSALAQTTQRAIADNGPITTWELGEAGNAEDAEVFFNKYIAPYLSLSVSAKKLSDTSANIDKTYNTLSGNSYTYSNSNVRAYMADGTSLTFNIQANNDTNKRIDFYIDINGDKKPNKLGKDIFAYSYRTKASSNAMHGKFTPLCTGLTRERNLSDEENRCHKNQTGHCCANIIMVDSWQIKDDYPW